MNKIIITSLLLLTTLTLSATETGETLLEQKCTSCHLFTSNSDKLNNGKMGGPPMWGIMKKIRAHYKTKKERIAFIHDYAMAPSEEKMLFPQATKTYFGLMPTMQEKVTDKEMQLIAEYLVNYQAVQ